MKQLWIKTLERIGRKPTRIEATSSVMAIICGLLFGLALMIVVNPAQAFPGFFTVITGPFQEGMRSLGNMLYFGVPIILTGLSVAFAFRTGLFNIGATGQLTMGALTAVYIGVNWGFLGPFHWVVAVLGAMIAGALWGAIPGLLKAFRNVHEVVTSIMLNYVAMYFNTMIILNFLYDTQASRTAHPLPSARLPVLFLQNVFPGSRANIGIFIAVLFVAIIHIVLKKTTFGYELKATGFSRDASRYAGMNEKRNIVLAMIIAGGISGVAGAMMYLIPGRHLPYETILITEGFTGIAIALLGLSAPIGVLLAGLFYGALHQGGTYLQLYDFRPEIIDIIIAVIIYFSALSLFLQKIVRTFINKRTKASMGLSEEVEAR